MAIRVRTIPEMVKGKTRYMNTTCHSTMAADKYLDELLDTYIGSVGRTRINRKEYRYALNMIVTNVALHNVGEWIWFCKSRVHFKEMNYGIKHNVFNNLINWLVDEKYVYVFHGFNVKGFSKISCFKGLGPIIPIVDDIRGASIQQMKDATYAIIKKDGKALPGNKVKLKKLGRVCERHFIVSQKGGKSRLKTDKGMIIAPMVRVFTNSYDSGGRFYANIQSCSVEERSRFLIDGEPVTEWDYKCMGLAILYHGRGLNPPEDSYDIPGIEVERDVIKTALLIVMGCTKRTQAIKAIITESNLSWEGAEMLVEMIEEHHSPIKDDMYKGNSLKSQFIDSQVAENVMDHFNGINEVVIPVHDSFIVKRSLENILPCAMLTAYQKVMGESSLIEITKEY